MQILLTNDDGITADGINAIRDELAKAHEVTVVAPDSQRSSCSHHVTVAETIRLRQVEKNQYSIHGFPADCVRVALQYLNLKPDLVISGINHGGNLGNDILLSGTAAAAREAALHGFPAMAVSQFKRPGCEVSWPISAHRFCSIIDELIAQMPCSHQDGAGFWNVNLPAKSDTEKVLGFVRCPPDSQLLPYSYSMVTPDDTAVGSIKVTELNYRCDYQNRSRMAGRDVDVCFGGEISASYIPVLPPSI